MKRLLAGVLCALALEAPAAAHVLDDYLQIAQLALAPDGVKIDLRLIPGVQVADRVLALIDVDGDGQVSAAEEQAYVRRVLPDLALELDGRDVPLALTGAQFPSWRELKDGIGTIRIELAAKAPFSLAGQHRLSFRNDHLPEIGAYLANALAPPDEITITGQVRDPRQRGLQLELRTKPRPVERLPWTGALILGVSLALLFRPQRRVTEGVN